MSNKQIEKSIFSVDYKEKIIWLEGNINQRVAYNFERAIARFKRLKLDNITFFISGSGGDVFAVFYMVGVIRNSGLRIGCVAHGYVASGCFILTQQALWTAALPKSRFVFHKVTDIYDSRDEESVNLINYLYGIERTRFLDHFQLDIFFRKGRLLREIYYLFMKDAKITVPKAIKLGLVDCYFSKKEFLEAKKIVMTKQRKKERNQ